jgi:hypothetical protein
MAVLLHVDFIGTVQRSATYSHAPFQSYLQLRCFISAVPVQEKNFALLSGPMFWKNGSKEHWLMKCLSAKGFASLCRPNGLEKQIERALADEVPKC